MRLIDADELKRTIEHRCVLSALDTPQPLAYGRTDIFELIDGVPTVEPKHGRWSIEDIITYERSYGGTLYEPIYKCSCCGRVTESYVRGDEPIMPEDADFPDYCPNCGARMDEVEE